MITCKNCSNEIKQDQRGWFHVGYDEHGALEPPMTPNMEICGKAEPDPASEMNDMNEKLIEELDSAEVHAWDALARYKFQMFGYWAAIWVHLNRITGAKRANPFCKLVRQARQVVK